MVKSTVRIPMPPSKRAKIFSPFDALKGFNEAIAAREKISVPRKELAEDRIAEIDKILNTILPGQVVTVIYYGCYEKEYIQKTGRVTKLDPFWHTLHIENIALDFSEIDDVQLADEIERK